MSYKMPALEPGLVALTANSIPALLFLLSFFAFEWVGCVGTPGRLKESWES